MLVLTPFQPRTEHRKTTEETFDRLDSKQKGSKSHAITKQLIEISSNLRSASKFPIISCSRRSSRGRDIFFSVPGGKDQSARLNEIISIPTDGLARIDSILLARFLPFPSYLIMGGRNCRCQLATLIDQFDVAISTSRKTRSP